FSGPNYWLPNNHAGNLPFNIKEIEYPTLTNVSIVLLLRVELFREIRGREGIS
ncbi:MAG: hypothetical protein RLY39_743, partial [Actinomycetota bacterium]